jgi:hypothetical protein
MHSDIASSPAQSRGFGCPSTGLPLGCSFEHLLCADRNAGEFGLIPELRVNWTPPPEPGSGKFGTPWARMHLARANPWPPDVPRLAVGLVEDPHAAISSPKLSMTAIFVGTPRCLHGGG